MSRSVSTLTFCSLLSMAAVQPQIVNGQSLSDGLIACFLMDGDASDAGPNAFHGSTNATGATDRHGTPGGALLFNGSATFFDLPDLPQFKPSFPLTVSLWMNATASTAGLYASDLVPNHYRGFWVSLNIDRTVNINFGNGGGIGGSSRRSEFTFMTFDLNEWYLLTAVFHSPDNMELYVGCEKVPTYPTGSGTALVYGSTPGSLGRHHSTTGPEPRFFQGRMDEVALWNRALDPTEIARICEGELATAMSVPDLGFEGGGMLEIYPNPADQLITVTVPGDGTSGAMTYRLIDATAKEVAAGWFVPGSVTMTIQVADIPAGNYWIIVEEGILRRRTAMVTLVR